MPATQYADTPGHRGSTQGVMPPGLGPWQRVAWNAAVRHGIDPRIFLRQINAESGFNPNARSPAGALGIAQIMPATARGWGVDPMNPRDALNGAARAMASYLRAYKGKWAWALAAYNAGTGAVAKYHGVPPYAETRNYVRSILQGQDVTQATTSSGSRGQLPYQQPGGSPTTIPGATMPGMDSSGLQAIMGYLASQQPITPPKLPTLNNRPVSDSLAAGVEPEQPQQQVAQGVGAPLQTPSGYTTGQLYDQLGALRRRLLT